MKSNQLNVAMLPRKVLCVALAAAFAVPALADEDDEVQRLIKPESNISLGVGHVSGDNQRFGVYNGLNKEGTVGLVDFSVVRRDDETGTWFRAKGRNLGLDNREFRVEHERQGQWGYFLDFNQITRTTPYDIRTNVSGLGTTQLTVPTVAGASSLYSFKTERQLSKLGFNRVISPELEFRLVFQNEEKEGKRLFGRGSGTAMEFLAEPINSTTRQMDAILDYTTDKFQLSGGYYGSFYNNHNPYLHINGGNAAAFGSGVGAAGVPYDNISLPPDNMAHQLHLTGAYQFTNDTRGSFKMARTQATQNDDFMPVRFYNNVALPTANGVDANRSGRTNLGGRVDTTLFQVGLTSRPVKNLSVLANFRYENRDDNTSIARYITGVSATDASGATSVFAPYTAAANGTLTTNGYNEPRSLTNKSGKLEASYLLPDGYRVTGGLDADQKDRTMAGVRIVGYRERTDETTYRLEVKRAMAETLTGSVGYFHSDRDGSRFQPLVTLNGTSAYPVYPLAANAFFPVTLGGLVQPIYMADRQRDKLRLALDWSPVDALSTQFMFEGARDDYGRGRGNPDIGARKGEARMYSVDATYALTDNWKLTGWAAHNENTMAQASLVGANANCVINFGTCGPDATFSLAEISALSQAQLNTLLAGMTAWSSQQKNSVDSFSVGVRGKLLSGRVDVGADYIYAFDKTGYRLGKENSGTAAVNGLPDITYRQATVKLFGRYALSKDMAMRLDYVFDQRKMNDWTWSGWSYTDGTQIVQRPEDKVHFIGVSMSYAFR